MLQDLTKNVTRPDGSWTVIPNPKSWRGISVFGAIALGEALHHHGHILPSDIKEKWMDRLAKVGDYLYKNFDMTLKRLKIGLQHHITYFLEKENQVIRRAIKAC